MSEHEYTHGRVVWRDLMTRDAAKARAFYSGLFGWTYEELVLETGDDYTLIKLDGKALGGLWQIPQGNPAPSLWMSYVSVPDVDAAARLAGELGGKVVHGPKEFPNLGRFVVLADSAGALIIAFRALRGDPPLEEPRPGAFCWETLGTPDEARAKAFYGKLFGWKVMKAGGGERSVFTTDGTPRGQLADLQDSQREYTPAWLTLVRVERLGPALDRVSELGGQTPVPLIAAPGLGRVAVISDPAGGHLCLLEPARK
ncbi:MAG: VOC family protein [Myxococcaceae bacterium]|nr:VOC family protein [Myxococcaceae bacterium]